MSSRPSMTSSGSSNPTKHFLYNDLAHIRMAPQVPWFELDNRDIFVTGGTGFIGCWLLETLVHMIEYFGLDTRVVVLTRDYQAFENKAPHLSKHRAINFHIGDIRNFDFPNRNFSIVIHAAVGATSQLEKNHPGVMYQAIIEGTRHTLDFARRCGAERFLFMSSGAVYGEQARHQLRESHPSHPIPTNPTSTYGRGKRAAEGLCEEYGAQFGIDIKIARGFAFVGPYLPLDIHFAVGNFISDGMRGGPIFVHGDGTPFRSYLYASDMMIWLWTILLKGQACRPYNVGSEHAISIRALAELIAGMFGTNVVVQNAAVADSKPKRYVPCTSRATKELQLRQSIDLETAIQKTIWFNQNHCKPRKQLR